MRERPEHEWHTAADMPRLRVDEPVAVEPLKMDPPKTPRWMNRSIVVFGNGRVEHYPFLRLGGPSLILDVGDGLLRRFYCTCATGSDEKTRVFVEEGPGDGSPQEYKPL